MGSGEIAFNRVAQLLPFIKVFEGRGGRIGPALEAAGLSHLDLSDPTALITGNALYAAVEEMAKALDDPFFAAHAAEKFVRAGPIFVRDSFATSHTLAEFLPLAILEIDQQISNIRYSLEVTPDRTLIRGKRAFIPMAPVVQADAAAACLWITLLRMLVGAGLDASRILVTAQESAGFPPELLPQSSFVKRNWNGVQIAFPSEWLKVPFVLDWKVPETQRGEFRDASAREAILSFIEKTCLERIGERSFGKDELAHHLGVHPKGLQRTLARLGTSFQEIRDNARRERALALLASDKPMSNEEMAEAIGFANSASFSRALKRWTGKAPMDYRKSL